MGLPRPGWAFRHSPLNCWHMVDQAGFIHILMLMFWILPNLLNVLIVVICGTSLYMRLFYVEAFDCIAPISFQCVKDYCYACRQLCDSSNILFICIQTTDWLDMKRCITIDMWPPFGQLSSIPAMQLTKQNTYILRKNTFLDSLKNCRVYWFCALPGRSLICVCLFGSHQFYPS